MTVQARIRGLLEWYRALRALNRILATMSILALFAGPHTGGATQSQAAATAPSGIHRA